VNSLKHEKPLKECFDIQARGPHKREAPGICPVRQMVNPALPTVTSGPEVIGVTFLTPALVPKKVTPAPAPELIGNLHSDSCLHSESLKAESILPHEVKSRLKVFCLWPIWMNIVMLLVMASR